MILVDTSSIWIDHLRARDEQLVNLLTDGTVLSYSFVIGEIALGGARNPARVLKELHRLPVASVATDQEVRQLEYHVGRKLLVLWGGDHRWDGFAASRD